MKYAILDFNGTICDDLDLSIKSINASIEKYLDREPLNRDTYREVFKFPVKEYYENVGFDFNKLSWDEVGHHWMETYQKYRKSETKLHDGVLEFLKRNIEAGNKNVVLSASRIDLLTDHLKELGVYEYFDTVLGIDNIFASSKIPLAINFIKDKNPDDCIMIGDTLHDFEVSKEIGIKCILIASGHQNRKTLETSGTLVYDNISEVII